MNASMPNLVRCLIFFSLFRGIKGDFVNNEEQGNIASRPQEFLAEYNFGKSADETVIIDGEETEGDGDFSDNRLGKILVENLELYKKYLEAQKQNASHERILQRKARERPFVPIECLTCLGYNGRTNDTRNSENCYRGTNVLSVSCGAHTKQCVTELHPFYIKRGCDEPDTLNITFFCKCTLCNNKQADNRQFFTYVTIDDWIFDNRRLQMPRLPGVTAACKYCNSTESGHFKSCFDGTKVDYTICNEKQLCFTTIDKIQGKVVRGCADKPAYNIFFNYCNKNNCNNENYSNVDVNRQTYGIKASLTTLRGSHTMCKLDTTLLFISFINLHCINTPRQYFS